MLGEYDRQVISRTQRREPIQRPRQEIPDGVHAAHPGALARGDRQDPRRPRRCTSTAPTGSCSPSPPRTATSRGGRSPRRPGHDRDRADAVARARVAFRGRDVLGRLGTSCSQHCQCVECMPGSVGRRTWRESGVWGADRREDHEGHGGRVCRVPGGQGQGVGAGRLLPQGRGAGRGTGTMGGRSSPVRPGRQRGR